jgi:hypothetical protein
MNRRLLAATFVLAMLILAFGVMGLPADTLLTLLP